MTVIIYDRVFWIYFIVMSFFLIIGLNFIITNTLLTNSKAIIIGMFWAISIINIFIVIYYLTHFITSQLMPCPEKNNRSLLIINIVFIVILILATVWTTDFKQPLLGVGVLIGSLIICAYSYPFPFVFWLSLTFLLLWLSITFYSL
jgi:hypothetical protein